MANPARATHLALRKLTLFWWPNLPKPADFTSGSKAIALVRLGEVAQYVLFIGLGLAALVSAPIVRARRLVLAVAIAGFWALHGAAYIIPRYRDPIMPLLILLAAGLVAQIVQERRDREALDEA